MPSTETTQSPTSPLFKKIPVTLLTGFLGAGKTTFLNRLLSERHGEKIAVIVNEFGSIGIDGRLIVERDEQVIEMENGCVCCSVRTDLIDTLTTLVKGKLGMEGKTISFDRVVIETTGLAEPVPIIQTFLQDEVIATCYELSNIVTLVDSRHFQKQRTYLPLVEEQIAFADVVVLNKIDLVSAEEIKEIRSIVQAINPSAIISEAEFGAVSFEEVFEKKFFDADIFRKGREGGEVHVASDHDHLSDIESFVLSTGEPLSLDRVHAWLGEMLEHSGPDILRYKGILRLAEWEGKRGILQGVHRLYTILADRDWKPGETKLTEMVFIGRNLDKKKFEATFAELTKNTH